MKKILFAISAVVLAFGLFSGCPEKESKEPKNASLSIKDFVPAEFESQSEGENAIEGYYICDAKDFVKKTQGILGKSKKKTILLDDRDRDEEDLPGLNLELPADAKRIAIGIRGKLHIAIEENKSTTIEDVATNAINGLTWWNVDENEEYFTGENAKKFNTICFYKYPKGGVLGTYGTINGKEVIVNKEQGLVFTKIEEEDYEELLKQNVMK